MTLICALVLGSGGALAQDNPLTISAPDELVDSGLMQHVLPRFSLKANVRLRIGNPGALSLRDNPPGKAVIRRGERIYYLVIPEDPKAQKFQDWITSDIGKRTIESFVPEDGEAFVAHFEETVETAELTLDGDPILGEALSMKMCGRCHVINETNRMNAIGSTPSFMVLRTLSDWDERFQAFYVLNPHGAFTQVEGVTPPFDPSLPSPIAPVEMTLDDLEAIIAYVAQTEPADLGAPLQHQ